MLPAQLYGAYATLRNIAKHYVLVTVSVVAVVAGNDLYTINNKAGLFKDFTHRVCGNISLYKLYHIIRKKAIYTPVNNLQHRL